LAFLKRKTPLPVSHGNEVDGRLWAQFERRLTSQNIMETPANCKVFLGRFLLLL
jgi:hypothetical protein